jgi:hypothetical protein
LKLDTSFSRRVLGGTFSPLTQTHQLLAGALFS